MIKEYFAKPDETIEQHVEKLIEVLQLLESYGYIQYKPHIYLQFHHLLPSPTLLSLHSLQKSYPRFFQWILYHMHDGFDQEKEEAFIRKKETV